VASGDVNLSNKDHTPNILFSAFSVFHHPVRSVKAKHSYIPPNFDNGRTKKFEPTASHVHAGYISVNQQAIYETTTKQDLLAASLEFVVATVLIFDLQHNMMDRFCV
jgi:hypothetical protein